MNKIITQLEVEAQDALNEPEPHDYYERPERIQALVKKLRKKAGDAMIISRTAYNKGYSDAMNEYSFHRIYKDDERHADYSFGFDVGLNEYKWE